MSAQVAHPTPASVLAEVLVRHRQEMVRLRAELGDPDEALSAFVREHFDQTALAEVARELREGGSFWTEDEPHAR